jgi:hypothetical protein
VTGLKKVAHGICSGCQPEVLFGEGLSPRELIGNLSTAKFVIAPYSEMISQALWMKGTLIEFIPRGSECREWTYEVSRSAGIPHLRLAIGNDTVVAEAGNDQCDPGFDIGLPGKVVLDVERVVEVVNKYLNEGLFEQKTTTE